MSLLELFFPIATVVLAAGCFICYRTNKPLREKAKAEAKAEHDKVVAEAKRLAQEARDAEVAQAVIKALKVLFDESRDYNVRTEEARRHQARLGYGERPPVFNRETREIFHKVIRVGALEERVGNIEEGNKFRREKHRELAVQVDSIKQAIQPYC